MPSQWQKIILFASISIILSACVNNSAGVEGLPLAEAPKLFESSAVNRELRALPEPKTPIDIAVYAYTDKTGQNEPSDSFAYFSRAVTQGAEAVLIGVLTEVEEGSWFRVVERNGIQNLLNERQLIERTRQQFLNKPSGLPPLRFAGTILEGGIVDYDVNQLTNSVSCCSIATDISRQS